MLLTSPGLPPCDDCKQWMYDDDWKRCTRLGVDLPRSAGTPTPCWKCPKGPVPYEKELSLKNWTAYDLYLQCKAGKPIPDDPIVHQNHALIRWVEDNVERSGLAAMRAAAEILRAKAFR